MPSVPGALRVNQPGACQHDFLTPQPQHCEVAPARARLIWTLLGRFRMSVEHSDSSALPQSPQLDCLVK